MYFFSKTNKEKQTFQTFSNFPELLKPFYCYGIKKERSMYYSREAFFDDLFLCSEIRKNKNKLRTSLTTPLHVFPLRFLARALRAWAINPWGKNLVFNLQYDPRTRLVRGIYSTSVRWISVAHNHLRPTSSSGKRPPPPQKKIMRKLTTSFCGSHTIMAIKANENSWIALSSDPVSNSSCYGRHQ